jgi:chlorobactene glucosyltransferase
MSRLPHVFAGLSLLAGPLAWQAERRYKALGTLTLNRCDQPLPALSIIIPARNEEENLRRLLPTLETLSYNGRIEIIVVDDQSTDRTSAVAQQFAKATLIEGEPLPGGWLGKPYACHQGALTARGEWLLFADADTLHQPDGPQKAVSYAIANNLDGLSLFLAQETNGSADTLALLVAFAGVFVGLPSQTSFLNGQYILLRCQVYLDSGGFSAVAGEALEDLALGHHLKSLGYRVPIMRGEEIGSVKMYRDSSALWHGLVRLGGGSLRWLGIGSLLTILFITAAMMPLIVFGYVISGKLRGWWFLAGWLSAVLGFLSWGRRFGSASWAFLAPFGAMAVQVAASWGVISRAFGRGFRWKGRIV